MGSLLGTAAVAPGPIHADGTVPTTADRMNDWSADLRPLQQTERRSSLVWSHRSGRLPSKRAREFCRFPALQAAHTDTPDSRLDPDRTQAGRQIWQVRLTSNSTGQSEEPGTICHTLIDTTRNPSTPPPPCLDAALYEES